MQLKATQSTAALLFSLLLISNVVRSQSNEEIKDTTLLSTRASSPATKTDTSAKVQNWLPAIGFGAGMMSFFGDIKSQKNTQPIRYRAGYEITVEKTFFNNLEVSLNGLFGNLYGNQREPGNNVNFKSSTTAFGLNFCYNFYTPFYHHANKPPFLTPYIGVGWNYLLYKTSTDLIDRNGNSYYYWSDGSIMDTPQNAAGYIYSNPVSRDYAYETALTKGGTLSIPVQAGVKFHLDDRTSMNLGAVYHLTQSDKIDNLETGKKDNFLFTHITLSYNLGASPYQKQFEGNDEQYKDVDFLALENEDNDGDGIKDFGDKCGGTPPGTQVDADGCPLDDDKDGVPNYLDLEANTVLGSQVNDKGEAITDAYIDKKNAEEEAFINGVQIADIIKSITYSEGNGTDISSPYGSRLYFDQANKQGVSFKVQLGRFKDGIPPDQVEAFMRIQDITNFVDKDGYTVYTAGAYGSKLAATSRRDELRERGMKGTSIIAVDKSGNLVDPNTAEPDFASSVFGGSTSYELIYKVQLGAFSGKAAEETFKSIEPLSKEPGPNHLLRYMAGSFSNYNQAAAFKNSMIAKGFDGAFVVAFKDGRRLDMIKTNGGNMPQPESGSESQKPVFKVQLGVYKKSLPEQVLSLYNSFDKLSQSSVGNGLTKYIAGSFTTYDEALRYKEDMVQKGIKGAFVIAFIGDRQVPLTDAIMLIK